MIAISEFFNNFQFSEMDDRKKLLIPLIAETLEKLPQNFELEKTTKISEPPHQQNVKAMFHQEMLRYNKMLDSIRTRLTNLNNALKVKNKFAVRRTKGERNGTRPLEVRNLHNNSASWYMIS